MPQPTQENLQQIVINGASRVSIRVQALEFQPRLIRVVSPTSNVATSGENQATEAQPQPIEIVSPTRNAAAGEYRAPRHVPFQNGPLPNGHAGPSINDGDSTDSDATEDAPMNVPQVVPSPVIHSPEIHFAAFANDGIEPSEHADHNPIIFRNTFAQRLLSVQQTLRQNDGLVPVEASEGQPGNTLEINGMPLDPEQPLLVNARGFGGIQVEVHPPNNTPIPLSPNPEPVPAQQYSDEDDPQAAKWETDLRGKLRNLRAAIDQFTELYGMLERLAARLETLGLVNTLDEDSVESGDESNSDEGEDAAEHGNHTVTNAAASSSGAGSSHVAAAAVSNDDGSFQGGIPCED